MARALRLSVLALFCATLAACAAQQAQSDLGLIREGVDHSQKVEGAMRSDGLSGEASRVATSRQQMQESADRLQRALNQAQSA